MYEILDNQVLLSSSDGDFSFSSCFIVVHVISILQGTYSLFDISDSPPNVHISISCCILCVLFR